jgi:hypothetical protein
LEPEQREGQKNGALAKGALLFAPLIKVQAMRMRPQIHAHSTVIFLASLLVLVYEQLTWR